ncbi:serine carboxypeptidase [Stylonychia lemnae]|uniref:Carboxypeptidase n=1 Tax=Stylonychia lemnae TaxID=5949 RepID=A0A078AVP5_STYLE|nr:serine carboxypeptidase [Stylonychia lemnae]|eukprot:CDW85332.1 serine carboxypeptidase [Stylonychia lemnae]
MQNLISLTLSLLLLSVKSNKYAEILKKDLNSNEIHQDIEDLQANFRQQHPQDPKCFENHHKIQYLPYWDKEVIEFPCMYAGTLNVSLQDTHDHNLFYWHFKNTSLTDPPLVFWMNGGPGSSSMFGLFLEHGPLKVTRTGEGMDDFSLGLNEKGSWLDIADLVYIDQPVGTGFSFGNFYIDRMETGAEHFVKFVTKFLKAYPEYKNREIYLSGESYAGKYLPHFTYKIALHNELERLTKKNNASIINLQATFIGDPFVSPIRQRTSTHLVAQGLHVIDRSNMGQVAALRKKCEESISEEWDLGSKVCGQTMDYIDTQAAGLYTYDGSAFDTDWQPLIDVIQDFLMKSNKKNLLYQALHVTKSYKTPIYERSSRRVSQSYDFEEMLDWSVYYDKCIEKKMKLIIYAGEYDQRDGPLTMIAWMKDLRNLQNSSGNFFNQSRKIYYYKDTNGSFQVGGYYRYDKDAEFTFLTVPKSGHFVPTTQLDMTKQMLKDFFENKRLVCHKSSQSECETSHVMCRAMNNCNSNGKCLDTGKCQCEHGFFGDDCTQKIQSLSISQEFQESYQMNGTHWYYFRLENKDNQILNDDEYFELRLSSQRLMDIYIKKDDKSEPTQFQNDMKFLKQQRLVISTQSFPMLRSSFIATVRVDGIDLFENKYHQHTLKASFRKFKKPQIDQILIQ